MKRLRMFNIIIKIMIVIISVSLFFCNLFNQTVLKSLSKLYIIPIVFIPSLMRLFFRKKWNRIFELVVILFIFFSYYIGYENNLYHSILHYDKLIHLLFGIVISFFALLILKRFHMLYQNIWFNIIFIISLSFACAVVWEFNEYFYGILFNKDEQQVKVTGLGDTMWDILATFVGALIYCFLYLVEFKKKKGLIHNYIKSLKEN